MALVLAPRRRTEMQPSSFRSSAELATHLFGKRGQQAPPPQSFAAPGGVRYHGNGATGASTSPLDPFRSVIDPTSPGTDAQGRPLPKPKITTNGGVAVSGGFGNPTWNDPNSPTYEPDRQRNMALDSGNTQAITDAFNSGDPAQIARAKANLTNIVGTSGGNVYRDLAKGLSPSGKAAFQQAHGGASGLNETGPNGGVSDYSGDYIKAGLGSDAENAAWDKTQQGREAKNGVSYDSTTGLRTGLRDNQTGVYDATTGLDAQGRNKFGNFGDRSTAAVNARQSDAVQAQIANGTADTTDAFGHVVPPDQIAAQLARAKATGTTIPTNQLSAQGQLATHPLAPFQPPPVSALTPLGNPGGPAGTDQGVGGTTGLPSLGSIKGGMNTTLHPYWQGQNMDIPQANAKANPLAPFLGANVQQAPGQAQVDPTTGFPIMNTGDVTPPGGPQISPPPDSGGATVGQGITEGGQAVSNGMSGLMANAGGAATAGQPASSGMSGALSTGFMGFGQSRYHPLGMPSGIDPRRKLRSAFGADPNANYAPMTGGQSSGAGAPGGQF